MPIRPVLAVAAALNLGGAIVFLPSSRALRALAGIPIDAPAVYLWTIAIWTAVFGAAYLAMAMSGRVERALVAVGAVAKLAFAAVVVASWISGTVEPRALGAAAGDAVVGMLLVVWLWQVRGTDT